MFFDISQFFMKIHDLKTKRFGNPWCLNLQNLRRITVGQFDENGNSTLVQNGMDWNVTLWYDKEA